MPWVYSFLPLQTGDVSVRIRCTLINNTQLESATTLSVQGHTPQIARSVIELPSEIACVAGTPIEYVIVSSLNATKVKNITASWQAVSFKTLPSGEIALRIEPPADIVPPGQSVEFPLSVMSQEESGVFVLNSRLTISRSVMAPRLQALTIITQETNKLIIEPSELIEPEDRAKGAQFTITQIQDPDGFVKLESGKIVAYFPYTFIRSGLQEVVREHVVTLLGTVSWFNSTWIVESQLKFIVYDRPAPYTVKSQRYRVEFNQTVEVPVSSLFESVDPVPGYYTASSGQLVTRDGIVYLRYRYSHTMQGYTSVQPVQVQFVDWFNRIWTGQIYFEVYRVPRRPYFKPFTISVGRGVKRTIDLSKFVVNPDKVKINGFYIISQGLVNYVPNWTVPEHERFGTLPEQVRTGAINLAGTGLNPPKWAAHGLFLLQSHFFGSEPTHSVSQELEDTIVSER